MTADGPRGVLDIGSNTIRLLVGRVEDGMVHPVLDNSEFVRLGLGVDRHGALQPDRMEAAYSAIEQLAAQARQEGAQTVSAIATSAVRDASNRDEFVRQVEARTGLRVRILSGDEEAQVTFRGATCGIDLAGGAIVVDLGGGSAELIAANSDGVQWERSLQLGSGRLTERFVHHDPPHQAELADLASHVTESLSALPPAHFEKGIYTGGTATHLTILLGRAQAEPVHLSLADIDGALQIVQADSAEAVAQRFNIRPERAVVLPAGLETLCTIAEFYKLNEVVVTRGGIREGVLLSESD